MRRSPVPLDRAGAWPLSLATLTSVMPQNRALAWVILRRWMGASGRCRERARRHRGFPKRASVEAAMAAENEHAVVVASAAVMRTARARGRRTQPLA